MTRPQKEETLAKIVAAIEVEVSIRTAILLWPAKGATPLPFSRSLRSRDGSVGLGVFLSTNKRGNMLQEEIQEIIRNSLNKEVFYSVFQGVNNKTVDEVYQDLVNNLKVTTAELLEFCMTLALARVNLSLTVR